MEERTVGGRQTDCAKEAQKGRKRDEERVFLGVADVHSLGALFGARSLSSRARVRILVVSPATFLLFSPSISVNLLSFRDAGMPGHRAVEEPIAERQPRLSR